MSCLPYLWVIESFTERILSFIEYLRGAAPLSGDSPVFELYLCVKSLLPCVLWIAMSYPYLGELLHEPWVQSHAR